VNWNRRKINEIRFFKKMGASRFDQNSEIPNGVARRKIRAMQSAREHRKALLSESNFSQDLSKGIQLGPYLFEYGYQRINLNIGNANETIPYSQIKFRVGQDFAYFNFTSCGQAAVSLSILAAMDMYKSRRIEFVDEFYYETHRFLQTFKISASVVGQEKKSASSRQRILFIDSSTQWDKPFTVKDYACFIVDTTCWSLSDPTLTELLKRLRRFGADVILARSHIKLDCLGTEWGRLGSVLFLTSQNEERTHTFRQFFVERSNPFGGRTEAKNVYPFLKSKEFLKLSAQWVSCLKAANAFVGVKLKAFSTEHRKKLNGLSEIRLFPHNLFVWIVAKDSRYEINYERLLRLRVQLKTSGVPSLDIASYPWDFVALTAFERVVQGAKAETTGVIRISIPDVPSSIQKNILRVLKHWLVTEFTER
jgi:hypothetical protein